MTAAERPEGPATPVPATPVPPAPAPAGRANRFASVRDVANGIVAIGVKELRGRMRGRRAFVVLTVHLVLVAGFAWMVEAFAERAVQFGGSISASADIGRELFMALTVLLTIIVLVLAPASTAGAISLEREKQTLDLLSTTPISSLAIVLGKLLSALTWVFLLLLASIPVMSLVFTFGGVGPEDLVRAYVVLVFTALGFGAMGLFFSALVRRTQAATMINLVTTIALTVGATIVFVFWSVVIPQTDPQTGAPRDLSSPLARPPEALLWFNPVVAEIDVMCGTETGFGGTCQIIGAVTGRGTGGTAPSPVAAPNAGFSGGGDTVILADTSAAPGTGVAPDIGVPLGVGRDTYWPRSVLAMVIVSILMIIGSAQLVSPTRRWQIRRPHLRPRASGSAAT
jgi:ABC-type transport system involved in multi-copper enzyme maturation permease subunit